jgi:hypothetical protein
MRLIAIALALVTMSEFALAYVWVLEVTCALARMGPGLLPELLPDGRHGQVPPWQLAQEVEGLKGLGTVHLRELRLQMQVRGQVDELLPPITEPLHLPLLSRS